jgi:hypothetical protein
MPPEASAKDTEARVFGILRHYEPHRPAPSLRQRVLHAQPRPQHRLDDRLLSAAMVALVLTFAGTTWIEHNAAKQMCEVATRARQQTQVTLAESAPGPAPEQSTHRTYLTLRRALPLPLGVTSPYVDPREFLSNQI